MAAYLINMGAEVDVKNKVCIMPAGCLPSFSLCLHALLTLHSSFILERLDTAVFGLQERSLRCCRGLD